MRACAERRRPSIVVVATLAGLAAWTPCRAEPPAGARVAIEEALTGPPVLEAAVDRLPGRRAAFPVAVRIACALEDLAGDSGEARLARLESRVAAYADRGVKVWLALRLDVRGEADASLRAAVMRRLSARAGTQVTLYELVVPDPPADARASAFAVKQAAVELRAGAASARIAIGGLGGRGRGSAGAAATLAGLQAEGVSAYVDGVVIAAGTPVDTIAGILQRDTPGAFLAESGVPIGGGHALVTSELDRLAGPVRSTSYAGGADEVREALERAAPVADLLSNELVRIEPSAASAVFDPVSVSHELFFDAQRFETLMVYARTPGSAGDVLDVALPLRAEARPVVRDPFTGARREPIAVEREPAGRTRLRVPLGERPLVLDFNDGAGGVVTDRTVVAGRAELSVGEIVARHQATRVLQDRLLGSYVALARMQQHFRLNGPDPGFDVVTENRYFADREGVEWEELSFSVNGTKWGADRPPFPLLQPEKVLAPPLDLSLTADYRYRLDGTAVVDGVQCYVVRFEPASREQARYRGTVWIDTASFRRVRLQTIQTGLAPPFVSSEEVSEFRAVGRIEDRDIVLPVESESRQIVLIAGRNILVEKASSFRDVELNPEAFAARRVEARRGGRIMYRDTDRGVRYYVKQDDGRVVSDRVTTSARAMAAGTTIDPSYGFPLPIFGINYLDFELAGGDSQFALLFGGVLALGNVQRPRLLGTPLDGSVDFFAIAVPGSDKVYEASGERESERVLTWPLSAGANLGYQFTGFQKISAQYQFRFDGYLHDRTTAEDFVTPASTTTHGLGAAYEYRRGGYSVVASGAWYGRASWHPWGRADALVSSPQTYTKYGLGVTKEYFLGVFSKVRVNAAYFGGRRLDRFSQYQFGLFDETKIHGVPASGVRMGELAMLRASYSFNVFEQYRLDLFLEGAVGRDRDASRPLAGGAPAARDPWEPITGLGAAFSLRVPWNAILRSDIGKSFLPDRYSGTGSVVVQVLLLKPL